MIAVVDKAVFVILSSRHTSTQHENLYSMIVPEERQLLNDQDDQTVNYIIML